MGKVKVELNNKGIHELLKSQEVEDACQAEAQKIAARCGSGYATDTKDMPTRQIASVFTTTKEALKDNYDNNTLLKAMGGGT